MNVSSNNLEFCNEAKLWREAVLIKCGSAAYVKQATSADDYTIRSARNIFRKELLSFVRSFLEEILLFTTTHDGENLVMDKTREEVVYDSIVFLHSTYFQNITGYVNNTNKKVYNFPTFAGFFGLAKNYVLNSGRCNKWYKKSGKVMKKAARVVAKQKKNEDIIESPTNRYENVRRYCRYYGVDF